MASTGRILLFAALGVGAVGVVVLATRRRADAAPLPGALPVTPLPGGITPGTPAPPNPPRATVPRFQSLPVVHVDPRGDVALQIAQRQMNDVGNPAYLRQRPLAVDGVWGDQTHQALSMFMGNLADDATLPTDLRADAQRDSREISAYNATADARVRDNPAVLRALTVLDAYAHQRFG